MAIKSKNTSCLPWGFRRIIVDANESVGVALHEARVMKKKSLADYASTLRIPERYLRALEEEDLSGLPGIVYEKNFIHRYALALGLSPTPLITGWSALRHNSIAPATARFMGEPIFLAKIFCRFNRDFGGRLSWRSVVSNGSPPGTDHNFTAGLASYRGAYHCCERRHRAGSGSNH